MAVGVGGAGVAVGVVGATVGGGVAVGGAGTAVAGSAAGGAGVLDGLLAVQAASKGRIIRARAQAWRKS